LRAGDRFKSGVCLAAADAIAAYPCRDPVTPKNLVARADPQT
jgi:hypothetical protein